MNADPTLAKGGVLQVSWEFDEVKSALRFVGVMALDAAFFEDRFKLLKSRQLCANCPRLRAQGERNGR
jgi:hypothetical protein